MIREIQKECTGLGVGSGGGGCGDGARIRRLMEEGGGADFEETERQRERVGKLLDTMKSLQKAKMILSEM